MSDQAAAEAAGEPRGAPAKTKAQILRDKLEAQDRAAKLPPAGYRGSVQRAGEVAWEVGYETPDGGVRRVRVPMAYGFDAVELAEWQKDNPGFGWRYNSYYLRWLALRRHPDENERPPAFEEWCRTVVDFYDIRPEPPEDGGGEDLPLP